MTHERARHFARHGPYRQLCGLRNAQHEPFVSLPANRHQHHGLSAYQSHAGTTSMLRPDHHMAHLQAPASTHFQSAMKTPHDNTAAEQQRA